MSGRKRTAEHQLARHDDVDDRDDQPQEEFATTPQIADAAELAQRRMVFVKRPTGTGTAASAPSSSRTGGFFKDVPMAPATTFGFGPKKDDGPQVPSATFGFGAAPAPAPKPEEAKVGEDGKPAPSSFGFNFGAPPSTDARKFSFDFGTKAPANASDEKKDGEAAASAPAQPGKFVFAASFDFSKNVASFTEAQKRLTEEKKANGDSADAAAKAADGANEGEKDGGDDADDAPKTFADSSSVVTLVGEVLANGPSKLYIFDKEGNKWKEHGEGDAKVKKDVLPQTEGETDSEKKEKTVYRLTVRDGYSLNAIVAKKGFVLTKAAEKHIIFSVATEGGGVETYLLKFTGVTAEATAKRITEEIKKVIEATE